MNAPLPEYGPEPQHPPRSAKEQERAFDSTRLEVDALRAMLSLPPQAERQQRREDDPEQPPGQGPSSKGDFRDKVENRPQRP